MVTILNPDATVLGETVTEWTEHWWTWALQAPANQNPVLDQTDHADQDNDGPVYFIAGVFGGTVDRTFEVPADKPLLVPLLNTASIKSPVPNGKEYLTNWTAAVTNLFAQIDGVSVQNPFSYFERTISSIHRETGSLLEAFPLLPASPHASPNAGQHANAHAHPSGSPAQAAGYYLMIEGLTPGEHTLHFGGDTSDGLHVDVTDHITVV